ncbi:HNH endonuclease (plasmid) [Rhodococcoides fascians A21d2]|uniref:HNH endonuclease n=1 Tax=Rhodococcoides fascians TaxID=1828 RepID=UPI00068AB018|nr:HNH endonuclease [Rhodococcus fascians]MDJ0005508.1 HNH endonuclease [Rhodococcus fascians]QII03824.1 HNH endonuclease [Rhodococcus fascians A21d2]
MAFWWASQGSNYPAAITQGSLWTCVNVNGRLPQDRALLQQIRPGDIVFHHYREYLRAVSTASSRYREAQRPPDYPTEHENLDDGWQVDVEPIVTDLQLHFSRVAELLPHGPPGPLNKNGVPQQKYLSALTTEQGSALLRELGLLDSVDADDDHGVGTEWPIAATDVAGWAARRVEQTALRLSLFGGRTDGECGICGRTLPSSLLVAGHIKPRALCTDAERLDFPSVAMLTCTLGCDALFENRYITVDSSGTIVPGRASEHPAVAASVSALAGLRCLAYTEAREVYFNAHRDLTVAGVGVGVDTVGASVAR